MTTEYTITARVRLGGRFDPATVLGEVFRLDGESTAEIVSVEISCPDGMPFDPEAF